MRDVVFCGECFVYVDYNGVIKNWRMLDELYYGWNDGKLEFDLCDCYDWVFRCIGNYYNDY